MAGRTAPPLWVLEACGGSDAPAPPPLLRQQEDPPLRTLGAERHWRAPRLSCCAGEGRSLSTASEAKWTKPQNLTHVPVYSSFSSSLFPIIMSPLCQTYTLWKRHSLQINIFCPKRILPSHSGKGIVVNIIDLWVSNHLQVKFSCGCTVVIAFVVNNYGVIILDVFPDGCVSSKTSLRYHCSHSPLTHEIKTQETPICAIKYLQNIFLND